MENMFSAGELAKLQNISKQTLLYYDKIGLFKPTYTNPENGYRYYGAEQLDCLDTILIMKKIGFSLDSIQNQMVHYNTKNSIASFQQQLLVIENQIHELTLIQSRLKHRCEQVVQACSQKDGTPLVETVEPQFLLCYDVESPYTTKEISIATKKCYAQALTSNLPIFFQCGVSVPLERIQKGQYIKASMAFLSIENVPSVSNVRCIPKGLTASIYHFGSYETIGKSYIELLEYCTNNRLKIISDSYEFCINDYITSKYEDEFITKIMFYIETDISNI